MQALKDLIAHRLGLRYLLVDVEGRIIARSECPNPLLELGTHSENPERLYLIDQSTKERVPIAT